MSDRSDVAEIEGLARFWEERLLGLLDPEAFRVELRLALGAAYDRGRVRGEADQERLARPDDLHRVPTPPPFPAPGRRDTIRPPAHSETRVAAPREGALGDPFAEHPTPVRPPRRTR